MRIEMQCSDCNVHIVWGDICADCDDARNRESDRLKFESPTAWVHYLTDAAYGRNQVRHNEPPSGAVR